MRFGARAVHAERDLPVSWPMAQQKRQGGIGVYVVGAPDPFIARLSAALPDATVTTARPDAPVRPADIDDLALAYAPAALAWARVGSLAALTRTVVVTEEPDRAEALTALENGADGYLDVRIEVEPLRAALLGVLRGELAYSREILGLSLHIPRGGAPSPRGITPRQEEILGLIAGGATDKEIANFMGMRTGTVQKNVGRLLRRLGAPNRAAAVARHMLPHGLGRRVR